ncbi:unnamed protein product [Gordionus sp. m RMFG-2023]
MILGKLKYTIISILLIWGLCAIYLLLSKKYLFFQEYNLELTLAENQIKALQKQNSELYNIFIKLRNQRSKFQSYKPVETHFKLQSILDIDDYLVNKPKYVNISQMPYIKSEHYRRKVQLGLGHLHKFISNRFSDFKSSLNKQISSGNSGSLNANLLNDKLNHMDVFIKQILNDLLSQSDLMKDISDDLWKTRLNARLSELVNQRIIEYQNPKNCTTARKLICDVDKSCGFGCQIHHVIYCLVVAFSSKRTLILKSENWKYDSLGFEHEFLPLSACSSHEEGEDRPVEWRGDEIAQQDEPRVIILPIIDIMSPQSQFLPLSIPSDLSQIVSTFHSRPHVWWVAQFASFVIRPTPHLTKIAEALYDTIHQDSNPSKSNRSPFQHPIVGIHVRRTDKIGTEASFHDISEYMKHVDDYFDILDLKRIYNSSILSSSPTQISKIQRRVYIATDDINVLNEATKKYPHYIVLGNREAAKSANTATRYSLGGLIGVYLDIYFLARCNYLVCTFSSQVCRLAFELANAHFKTDVSDNFYSLDDIYYYGGGRGLYYKALRDQEPITPNEIETVYPYGKLKAGNKLELLGDEKNGYSLGKILENGKTKGKALFPSHILEEIPLVAGNFFEQP